MTTAQHIIQDQRLASLLSQCRTRGGIVKEEGYGFAIYQFHDLSVLVQFDDGEIIAYETLKSLFR